MSSSSAPLVRQDASFQTFLKVVCPHPAAHIRALPGMGGAEFFLQRGEDENLRAGRGEKNSAKVRKLLLEDLYYSMVF